MLICRRLCWGLLLTGLLFPALSHAQIRSATITGTVTDSTGGVVPGATVVVTNEATNETTEAVTTDAGQFTVPYLPAGRYTVEASLAGRCPL